MFTNIEKKKLKKTFGFNAKKQNSIKEKRNLRKTLREKQKKRNNL